MSAEAASSAPRFWWLDAARGGALLAMASYHLIWDLELFGYLDPGTASSGLPRLYARAIAASFLFLAGFGLALAHRNGFRAFPFAVRLARIAGAAALITVATWFAMPDSFIFFGILHQIALAGIIGLAFVRLPPLVTAGAAALSFALPSLLPGATETPMLDFIGLSATPAVSNDFVPLFPWLAACLAGIAAARALIDANALPVPSESKAAPAKALVWLGRRSLAVYLVHQPVLIALVWLASQALPPAAQSFAGQCFSACEQSFDHNQCQRYCNCFEAELKLSGINPDTVTKAETSVEPIIAKCSAVMHQP